MPEHHSVNVASALLLAFRGGRNDDPFENSWPCILTAVFIQVPRIIEDFK
jgi:hypothetical protein